MAVNFQDLSTELLLKIFEYCDIRDLLSLQKTCSRFLGVIYNARGLGNTVPILITNQLHPDIRNRCIELLTVYQKSRLSYNWKNGIYKEHAFLKETKKYIPCLILSRDHLWISKANVIHKYARNKHDFLSKKPVQTITIPTNADVGQFVYKQNRLVSGQHDGSILTCDASNKITHYENCHASDIHTVDLEGPIIASGSKDGVIKMWNFHNLKPDSPIETHQVGDRVWSTAFSTGGQYLAIGASARTVAPLYYIDINKPRIIQNFNYTFPLRRSGILHLKWENPNILLSCGYDRNVRMWDIRNAMCVNSWEDQFYSIIYCFETDTCCSIVAGTQLHGRTILWDTRSKNAVQMYFMESCKQRTCNSPIYSLSFDVTCLFTATDRHLNVLDFSVKGGKPRNYNSYFTTKVRQLYHSNRNH